MTTFKKFLAVGVTSLMTLSGVGVATAATTATPQTPSSHHSLTEHAVKVRSVHFKGTYKGTIAMLWSSSSVQATAVRGTGTGTLMGKSKISGKGSATTASTCDPLSGNGVIVGGGSKLFVKVVSSSKTQACAAGQTAPTQVTVTGVATVTNGTGKYKGAKGTLKVNGTFQIQSNKAGSSETDSFSATLAGVLKVR